MKSILELSAVEKSYSTDVSKVDVLRDLSFQLPVGAKVAVLGPSGSGKTTFLSLAAGLELPDNGSITLNGKRIDTLNEEERATVRAETIGFVFQTFELIQTLTAKENVMVPAELLGNLEAEPLAEELLREVGLIERATHLPSQLSGGERQRVAIARAFINRPKLLFADEPTGNLDRATAKQIIELLFALNEEQKTTLLIATHDLSLAERCERVYEFTNEGKLEQRSEDS